MIYENAAIETADTLTPIGYIYCNFYHKQNVLTSTEYVQWILNLVQWTGYVLAWPAKAEESVTCNVNHFIRIWNYSLVSYFKLKPCRAGKASKVWIIKQTTFSAGHCKAE